MTRRQRQIHFLGWLAMAVALGVGIGGTIAVRQRRPATVPDALVAREAPGGGTTADVPEGSQP